MTRLPESTFAAQKQADPRAVLRLVPHGEDPARLPDNGEDLIGRGTSVAGMILKPLLLIAVSVGFVWLVTVNAWDHDDFFPWFWNIIWLLFPWVFLLPLWIGFFRSLIRKPGNDSFRHAYAQQRLSSSPLKGTVLDTSVSRNDSGGVAAYAALIGTADGRELIVGRFSPGPSPSPHEVPHSGDEVRVWRLSNGWTIVQAPRDRVRTEQTTTPASPAGGLAEEIERLAALHRDGALTDAEFEAAKRRALGA